MAPRGTILLVDDEEKILKTLGRALRDDGHEVLTAASVGEAQKRMPERAFDLLIVDHRMPDRTGLELIEEVVGGGAASGGEQPEIVMMTAHATVESAIAAMKLGALDYLQKPFEVDELLVVARRAVEHHRLRTQQRYLLSERDEEFNHYGIVGRSRAIQELIATIDRIARSRSTVLILGETGTGKELVARAIHDRSEQREMPLIKVNCAALPESLLESELFGHVRGAFTGATSTKKGRFALADGGTIFLDEIGTVAPAVQAKLLRVVQEREFEPLGAERTHRVDVRVIAATNRDLRRLVAEGRFQEDLYYRLSVIPLTIPPLRERREDIPLLAEHFIAKHSHRVGRRIDGLAPGVLAQLQGYEWPGNVRELENTIERAVVLTGGPRLEERDVSMLGATTAEFDLPSLRLRDNVEWVERETIRRALRGAREVKKDAAELLGLSQRALSYYLSKYKIE